MVRTSNCRKPRPEEASVCVVGVLLDFCESHSCGREETRKSHGTEERNHSKNPGLTRGHSEISRSTFLLSCPLISCKHHSLVKPNRKPGDKESCRCQHPRVQARQRVKNEGTKKVTNSQHLQV